MPEMMQRQVEQAREFWRNLDSSHKSRIYITSALVVVAVIILLVVITRPNRMTLFSSNDRAQVGEMSQLLTDAGIWNRLEGGGTSIVIDTKNNDRAQVMLAQEGFPRDGMRFEDAISMIGLTTTDNEKRRIWRAQTTSDIETKIKLLDNIDNATVQLAIPEPQIFLTESRTPLRPTSTVTVWPRGGGALLPSQVDGIKKIVMGSVEDMAAENIMVIDNFGNPLEGTSDVDPMTQLPNQEDLRNRFTRDLENKIFRLYGMTKNDAFDSVSVVASPFLDFSPLEFTSENLYTPEGFDPGEGALLERHLRRESATNYAVGGVPAMDTNPGETVPIYPMRGDTGVGEYTMLDDQTAFGYNRRIETGSRALGEFIPERSHLSIVLGYGIDVEDDASLTEEFIRDVQLSASNATSIPISNISVTRMRLARPVVPIVPITERIQGIIAEYGILILLLFLIATLILSLFVRGRKKEDERVEDLQLQIAEGIIEPDDARQFEDVDLEEKSEIRDQLEKLIKQRPEAVASLLRNWLTEEWEQ